ncbi:MAG: NYN domain-containing protein, partial [Dehalococcoidia bacterium]
MGPSLAPATVEHPGAFSALELRRRNTSSRLTSRARLRRFYVIIPSGACGLPGLPRVATRGIFFDQSGLALATHLEAGNPHATARHRAFLRCLRESGVLVELSRFKKKTLHCPECGAKLTRHEEKETDVAIAARLIKLMVSDQADTVAVVSGDTDLAPAVRLVQQLYPEKSVGFAFPYRRKNKELDQLADFAFQISKEQYAKYQLPDPYVTRKGVEISKPVKIAAGTKRPKGTSSAEVKPGVVLQAGHMSPRGCDSVPAIQVPSNFRSAFSLKSQWEGVRCNR